MIFHAAHCRRTEALNSDPPGSLANEQLPSVSNSLRNPQQSAVQFGDIVPGVFTPVLAKHLSLVDALSIGIDRIQRNFEPVKKQVEAWKATRIPDETVKLVIYRASSRASWMFRSTSPGASTTYISIRRSTAWSATAASESLLGLG